MKTKNYTKSKQKAFTLVELMIACGIVTVALCGLLMLFNYCYDLSMQAATITYATSEAYGMLDEIRAQNFSGIVAYCNAHNPFQLTQISGSGTIATTAVTTTLIDVQVNVAWTYKGRALSFTLKSLIAER